MPRTDPDGRASSNSSYKPSGSGNGGYAPGGGAPPSKKSSGTKKSSSSHGSSRGSSSAAPAAGKQDSRMSAYGIRQQFQYPFDITPFVDQAIRSGQDSNYLLGLIYSSPQFKTAFPGIFRPDGSMRITPAEYQSSADRFRATAAQYGFQLSHDQIGGLIAGDKTPQEFEQTASAIQLFKTNPGFKDALNQQIQDRNADLIRQGKSPIKTLNTFKDAVDFLTERAPQEAYDLYESAQFASAAKEAGLVLNNRQARELAAATPGVLSYADVQKGIQEAASQLLTAGADVSQFGLSQQDVVDAQFGKMRAGVGQKLLQALHQARAKSQAQQAVAVTQYDTGRPVTPSRQEASL